MHYARMSDGITIAYQVSGRGPALVWLPSLGNVVAQWRVPVLRAAYEHLGRSVRLMKADTFIKLSRV